MPANVSEKRLEDWKAKIASTRSARDRRRRIRLLIKAVRRATDDQLMVSESILLPESFTEEADKPFPRQVCQLGGGSPICVPTYIKQDFLRRLTRRGSKKDWKALPSMLIDQLFFWALYRSAETPLPARKMLVSKFWAWCEKLYIRNGRVLDNFDVKAQRQTFERGDIGCYGPHSSSRCKEGFYDEVLCRRTGARYKLEKKMNISKVGTKWQFINNWLKTGFLKNAHSKEMIDLPSKFGIDEHAEDSGGNHKSLI